MKIIKGLRGIMLRLIYKNGTRIEWNPGDDGGGSTQYLDFLQVMPTDKKYKKCLEWCAGCSAISFSLMDAGMIEELVLMDIYRPALDQALVNAKKNNFDKVSIYELGKIADLPVTEKFDLVVSNPPHCIDDSGLKWAIENNKMLPEALELNKRLVLDQDFLIHKEFYTNITKHLNDGAELFISENHDHPGLNKMIKEAGLELVGLYKMEEFNRAIESENFVIYHLRYEEKVH